MLKQDVFDSIFNIARQKLEKYPISSFDIGKNKIKEVFTDEKNLFSNKVQS